MKMPATMLRILATLAAVLGLVKGVTVTIPEKSVNTTVGANITLPCTYQTASAPAMIQWSFYSAKYQQSSAIYLWQLGKAYYLGQFKGRIQVANNMGNATLSIANMQPSDTGVYRCLVFNPNDTNPEAEKSVSVSVLVPPSKPLCSFGSGHHPDVEIGHLITLFCISKLGLPLPTYKWYKLNGDEVKPVTELYDPYAGRLVLGNLTRFEEGHYQCTAANPLGNSSCHIDLTTKHSESGIIVGALIAAILAAALICVLGWILISKEKKKRKQKPVLKEMQTMSTKAEYATVPSQTSVPVAAVPPSQEPNEIGEHGGPEEAQVAIMPETQEMGH
ncbi:V-set and immunoglobulin domain-containing protein 1 [Candoia aspera]|uniref:V-set and immunoglobulin domain-containing protein 1 n=1 Tax=Candoia aspera TaxID=51853 RepID=UPI002FD7AED5